MVLGEIHAAGNTSQIPVDKWHDLIGDPTYAVHRARHVAGIEGLAVKRTSRCIRDRPSPATPPEAPAAAMATTTTKTTNAWLAAALGMSPGWKGYWSGHSPSLSR
jgi:hypothetical protein